MASRRSTNPPPATNPFVRQAPHDLTVIEDDLGVDELFGTAVSVRGPSAPLLTPSHADSSDDVLTVHEVTSTPTVCVAGAHGGAGTSTVTALLGETALDAGVSWPVAGGWTRPLPVLPVLLVARTHGAGLFAAERVAKAWAANQLTQSRLIGLVLVDDAPHLTKAQRTAAARVARMTPNGWHLGWDPQWRESVVPSPSARPTLRVRRTLEQIRRAAAG